MEKIVVKKEKGRFIITVKEQDYRIIDINNGIMLGTKNTPVFTLGLVKNDILNAIQSKEDCLPLRIFLYYTPASQVVNKLKDGTLLFIDKLVSLLGVKNSGRCITDSTLENFKNYPKEMTDLLKNREFRDYIVKQDKSFSLNSYDFYKKEMALIIICKEYSLTVEEKRFISNCTTYYPDFLSNNKAVYWIINHYLRNPLIREYSFRSEYYFGDNLTITKFYTNKKQLEYIPITYIKICDMLGREYATTNWYYDNAMVQDLMYNYSLDCEGKMFRSKYDEKLKFEDDKYCVILPNCGQDLIDEGKNMHHCVGSYVSKVLGDKCLIVFIRKKENPNVPYITAEIVSYGLAQRFLELDKAVTDKEDLDFLSRYSNYLDNNRKLLGKLQY